jgi:ribosome-associated translation inhibitor RaiA
MTLHIAYRHMHARPELEALIRERHAWLEECADGLQSCHVTLEPHHGRFSVHLHLKVEGEHLDVIQDDHSADDHKLLEGAIRDAFQRARRRLRDLAERHGHGERPWS